MRNQDGTRDAHYPAAFPRRRAWSQGATYPAAWSADHNGVQAPRNLGAAIGAAAPWGAPARNTFGAPVLRPENRAQRGSQGATKGYTLVEVMLVVAIIGIMVGIGPRIMIQFQRFLKLTDARDAIQKDARTSLDTINRTLRQGKSSSIVIDQASGQPPYSRVTFTTISDISVTVYQQNKYLYMTRGNTTSVLSRDLRYIAFTFPRSDDPTIVSVSITMERASYEGGTKALELSIEKVRVMN